MRFSWVLTIGVLTIGVLTVLLMKSALAADVLPEVVVYGEEIANVGDVELSEHTGSYAQIGQADLQRNAEPLAAVIADETGVQFRQIGGLGSYSAITVRAATAAQTGIYLDGVLLNHAAGGGVDLSQLELLNIAQVDIYRGSTPVQLSHSAIGGAVNLKTPRIAAGAQVADTSVLVGAGSFTSPRLQFSLQGRQRDWDSILSLSHRASDNDYEFINDNGTPANPRDDRRERRNNAEFERSALLFKLGHDRSSSHRYDAVLQFTDREQGVPHWRNIELNEASWATRQLQLQLNRRVRATGAQRWNHTESIYINRDSEHYDDSLSQIGLAARNNETDIDITGIRSYWEHLGDSGTLALNFDARVEDVTQLDRIGTRDFDVQRQQLTMAAQYGLFLFNDSLLLTPALRFVSVNDHFDGVTRAGRDRVRSQEATLQLGAKWQSSDTWFVFANIGEHQREPLFFELFGDRGLFVGNDELQAESGVNADLGLQWSPDTNSRLGITAFASERDELIVNTYNAQGIGRSENSGEARILGLELFANRQWSERIESTVNLTLQSAENRSSVFAYRGKQLPGEAQLAAHGRLKYRHRGFSAWYETDILQQRFYDLVNALPADDQWLHNIGMSYSSRRWSTSLSIQNIGNENIEDFFGYLRPGRSVHLTFTYN